MRSTNWPPHVNKPDSAVILTSLAVLALPLIVGCGPRGKQKYEVRGIVTWNGEPVENGSITFFPGAGVAPEAGKIVNGKFSFSTRPGKCRVAIRAERFAGMIESMNQPRIEQYIPPEYNVESTVTAEVLADGDNEFTFALPL